MSDLDRTTPELADMSGLTVRQLDHWARRGYLQPTYAGRKGSGHARVWMPAEVEVVMLMGRLVAAKFPPDRAATIARVMLDLNLPSLHLGHGVWLTIGDES